jgi:hypothetical protein
MQTNEQIVEAVKLKYMELYGKESLTLEAVGKLVIDTDSKIISWEAGKRVAMSAIFNGSESLDYNSRKPNKN